MRRETPPFRIVAVRGFYVHAGSSERFDVGAAAVAPSSQAVVLSAPGSSAWLAGRLQRQSTSHWDTEAGRGIGQRPKRLLPGLYRLIVDGWTPTAIRAHLVNIHVLKPSRTP